MGVGVVWFERLLVHASVHVGLHFEHIPNTDNILIQRRSKSGTRNRVKRIQADYADITYEEKDVVSLDLFC